MIGSGKICKTNNSMADSPVMVQYHNHDFDFSNYAEYAVNNYQLPKVNENYEMIKSELSHHWNKFYSNHKAGNVYKPRRYLFSEFKNFLSHDSEEKTILEVGCGHGCSIFPLLESTSCSYIASDYSEEALNIMKADKQFDASRITTIIWDITTYPPSYLLEKKSNIILCIFTLSAIHPDYHLKCFQHLAMTLQKDNLTTKSSILFRDYAVHDMTMYEINCV